VLHTQGLAEMEESWYIVCLLVYAVCLVVRSMSLVVYIVCLVVIDILLPMYVPVGKQLAVQHQFELCALYTSYTKSLYHMRRSPNTII
jgi:hypothetical protein